MLTKRSNGTGVSSSRDTTRAIVALCLIVPAPSVGIIASMVTAPGTPLGMIGFVAGKLWMFLLPLGWLLFVERRSLSLSPARRGGFGLGAILGVAIAALIVGAYVLVGPSIIDPAHVREVGLDTGIARPWVYAGVVAYWVLVNSVLEEYVYRWFAVEQLERLVATPWAIVGSAFFFTIHHVIGLALQFDWIVTLLGSCGVFAGGVIWSWMYARYRSVWPGYLSHAIVDVAIFAIGGWIFFGPS